MRRLVLLLSFASLAVTIPHVIEDFVYGVHRGFGLALIPAALVVGLGYAFQVAGLLLLARGSRGGLIITLVAGIGWFLGVALDHLPDILFTFPYREGTVSKLLEILILLLGGAMALSSGAALASRK